MIFLFVVLIGVDVSGSIHEGLSFRLFRVTVGRLDGFLVVSGLSLALFRVLPWGGLMPRLGCVVILSRLGWVYGPNRVGSTCI